MIKRKEKTSPGGKAAKRPAVLLLLLIVCQLVWTIFSFAVNKTGIYGDEPWGYGLANSYYQPFIYIPDGISIDNAKLTDTINMFEWQEGSVFEDYITVQKGEQFAYGSVIHNQTLDHHPPLYYMLLHTVCSFFPDSFSYWYGFLLQCVFLVVTQIFLYKLGRLVLKDDIKPLIACLFYGGGTGALSTFLFIRQYSLLTMLTVVYAYFAARLYYSGGEKPVRCLTGLAVFSLLAFLTHYYSILFIGLMTAFMCLYFLFRKKIKVMLSLGGTELASLGLFLLIYPAVIRQMRSSSVHESHTLEYFDELRLALSYVLRSTLGIHVALMRTSTSSIAAAVVILLIALAVPLCFLFRKEPWFKKLFGNVREYLKALFGRIKAKKTVDIFAVSLAAAVIVVILFLNWQTDAFYYETVVLRYYFFILPFICLLAFLAADKLIRLLIPRVKKYIRPVLAVITVLVLVRVNVVFRCPMFFKGVGSHDEIRQDLAGKECLLVIPGQDTVNMVSAFASYIGKTSHTFSLVSYYLPECYEEITGSEYYDRLDRVIVSSAEYVFSDEQHAVIEELLENSDSGIDAVTFMCEDEENAAVKGIDIELDESLKNVGEGSDYMTELNRVCPQDSFSPKYIINLNGFNYVVMEKTS